MAMEYMHATLMLHESGREINEENITSILEANGTHVIESRVKAIVAALEGVDIDAIEPEPDPAIAATVRGEDVPPGAVLESGVEAEPEGIGTGGSEIDGGDAAGVEADTEVASDAGERERTDSDGEVADDVAGADEARAPDEESGEASTSESGDTTDDADTGGESSTEESSSSADETDEATWEFPADDDSESESADEADDEEDGAR